MCGWGIHLALATPVMRESDTFLVRDYSGVLAILRQFSSSSALQRFLAIYKGTTFLSCKLSSSISKWIVSTTRYWKVTRAFYVHGNAGLGVTI